MRSPNKLAAVAAVTGLGVIGAYEVAKMAIGGLPGMPHPHLSIKDREEARIHFQNLVTGIRDTDKTTLVEVDGEAGFGVAKHHHAGHMFLGTQKVVDTLYENFRDQSADVSVKGTIGLGTQAYAITLKGEGVLGDKQDPPRIVATVNLSEVFWSKDMDYKLDKGGKPIAYHSNDVLPDVGEVIGISSGADTLLAATTDHAKKNFLHDCHQVASDRFERNVKAHSRRLIEMPADPNSNLIRDPQDQQYLAQAAGHISVEYVHSVATGEHGMALVPTDLGALPVPPAPDIKKYAAQIDVKPEDIGPGKNLVIQKDRHGCTISYEAAKNSAGV